ncbi:MAG: 8-oxo-dGTP pyrophosphatase MutT (NUDIX family) [Paracoccaceae bacterium]|jgi:8-oxo-dGTP pyrophosphatase MutT (NUDIX family)
MGPEVLKNALSRSAVASSDFDLNVHFSLPAARILRSAAVLVTVWQKSEGAFVVLTKRSRRLLDHPGQISFPGGKVEDHDSSAEAAALREAHEEIGLNADNLTVIGALASHETITGFQVTPILAHLTGNFTPCLQISEVDEVFVVPLAHVANLANFRIERRRFHGEWRYFYVVPYGPYYIWGATARILRDLAERVQP